MNNKMDLLITKERGEELFNERKREARKRFNEGVEEVIKKYTKSFYEDAFFDFDKEVAIEGASLFGFVEMAKEMEVDYKYIIYEANKVSE